MTLFDRIQGADVWAIEHVFEPVAQWWRDRTGHTHYWIAAQLCLASIMVKLLRVGIWNMSLGFKDVLCIAVFLFATKWMLDRDRELKKDHERLEPPTFRDLVSMFFRWSSAMSIMSSISFVVLEGFPSFLVCSVLEDVVVTMTLWFLACQARPPQRRREHKLAFDSPGI